MVEPVRQWWAMVEPMVSFDLRRPLRVWHRARQRGLAWLLVAGPALAYVGWLAYLALQNHHWILRSVGLSGQPVSFWALVVLPPFTANLVTQDRAKQRFESIATLPLSDRAWLWGRLATPFLVAATVVAFFLPPLILGAILIAGGGALLGSWVVIIAGAMAAALCYGLLAALLCGAPGPAQTVALVLGLLTCYLPLQVSWAVTNLFGLTHAGFGLVTQVSAVLALVALGVMVPLSLRYAERNVARRWRYRPESQAAAGHTVRTGLVGGRTRNPVFDREVAAGRQRRHLFDWSYGLTLVLLGTWLVVRYGPRDPETWVTLGFAHMALLSVMAFALQLIAAASITGERDRNTWEALLATPLRASTILWGKIAAAFVPARWPLLGALVLLPAMIAANPGTLPGPKYAVLGYGTFAVMLAVGLSVGLRSRSTSAAAAVAVFCLPAVQALLLAAIIVADSEPDVLGLPGAPASRALGLLLPLLTSLALVDGSVARLSLLRDGRVAWRPRLWLALAVAAMVPFGRLAGSLTAYGSLLAVLLIHAEDLGRLSPRPRWWQFWRHAPATGLAFVVLVCAAQALANAFVARLDTELTGALLGTLLFAAVLEWARPRIRQPLLGQVVALACVPLTGVAVLHFASATLEPAPLVYLQGSAVGLLPFVGYVLVQGWTGQSRTRRSGTAPGG